MTFEEICSIFGAEGSGDSLKCRCPAHDDRKSSLSISRGENGRTVLHCFAGCDLGRILQSRGIWYDDLIDETLQDPDERWKRYVEGCCQKKGRRVVGYYDYHDPASGCYCYTRVRTDPKSFSYGQVSAGRWSWGLSGKRRKDFKAIFTAGGSVKQIREAAAAGDRVFYTEGEKDALTLAKRGFKAVTAGGADDWQREFAEVLRDAEAIVTRDNDKAGLELALKVAHDLTGIAKSVTVINPVPDVPKADITDYFERGGTVDGLDQMISEARSGAVDNFLTGAQAVDNSSALQDDADGEDRSRFHTFSPTGRVTGIFDFAIFEYLCERENIRVIAGVPYIYDNGIFKPDRSGAKLKTWIRELCYPEVIKSSSIKRVYDLFTSASELEDQPEGMNQYPLHWICFKNGMFDPVTRQMLPHDPKYRCLNMVPHEYHPDDQPTGKTMDQWLRFALPAEDDREMVLEFAGLCLTRDITQQKFLILNGLGGTGKSTLIKLIETIVGRDNISNIPLQALSQRFAAIGLMGRLMNSCADLDFKALEDVGIIKQALGEDGIRGEAKGKDAISFWSYARLLFSTNEIPTVRGERTNAFYRRLLICNMNSVPVKVDPGLGKKLEREIDYFLHAAVEALSRMYEAGQIAESAGSREAVEQLYKDSDSVEAWITDTMYRVRGSRMERGELFSRYTAYCDDNDRQALQRVNFFKALRSKGLSEVKSHGFRHFIGLSATAPSDQDGGRYQTTTAPQSAPQVPQADGFIDVTGQIELPFD